MEFRIHTCAELCVGIQRCHTARLRIFQRLHVSCLTQSLWGQPQQWRNVKPPQMGHASCWSDFRTAWKWNLSSWCTILQVVYNLLIIVQNESVVPCSAPWTMQHCTSCILKSWSADDRQPGSDQLRCFQGTTYSRPPDSLLRLSLSSAISRKFCSVIKKHTALVQNNIDRALSEGKPRTVCLSVTADRFMWVLWSDPSSVVVVTATDRDEDESTTEARDTNGRIRSTLCISSEVGCQMGCTFCATGETRGLDSVLIPHSSELLTSFYCKHLLSLHDDKAHCSS